MADVLATRNDAPELAGKRERWVDLGDGTYARKVVAVGPAGGSLAAPSAIDDAAFVPGAGLLAPIGALADESGTDLVDEGDLGAPRMTLNRVLRVVPSLHDGTQEAADSLRGCTQGTLLALGARTTGAYTPVQTNVNARGVILSLQVTAGPGGSETLSLYLRFQDPVSSSTANVLAVLAVPAGSYSSRGLFRLIVAPGASSAPESSGFNKAYALPLPRMWLAQVDPSGSGSWTYSLAYQTVL
ncbi:MAG TPA: hypothetical protein VGN26_22255 [Armatimonadota bacterium]